MACCNKNITIIYMDNSFIDVANSHIYQLNKNEITMYNGAIIGIIYVKVSSKKFFSKWSKRYFVLTHNILNLRKPKKHYDKCFLLDDFKLSGITSENRKIIFSIKNKYDNKILFKFGSVNQTGILEFYDYLCRSLKRIEDKDLLLIYY